MMTAETYKKLSAPFRKNPNSVKRMEYLNTVLTAVTYVAYIVLVVSHFVWTLRAMLKLAGEVAPLEVFMTSSFARILLVPAIGFAGVTIFRKVFNAKRPYQLLDIEPLLSKRKEGQSFPSRHTFSIFMIAMALGYVCVPFGIVFLILGVWLATVRVIGGVHFPKDVIAGAVIAVLWGWIGFYLLGSASFGLFASVPA